MNHCKFNLWSVMQGRIEGRNHPITSLYVHNRSNKYCKAHNTNWNNDYTRKGDQIKQCKSIALTIHKTNNNILKPHPLKCNHYFIHFVILFNFPSKLGHIIINSLVEEYKHRFKYALRCYWYLVITVFSVDCRGSHFPLKYNSFVIQFNRPSH